MLQILLKDKQKQRAKDSLPKVMTAWALTLEGREFALNWDRGSEAGSSSGHSVNNQDKEQVSQVIYVTIQWLKVP